MHLYNQVFSGSGSFDVADTNTGEDVLAYIAASDPNAEIIIKDSDTDEVHIGRQLLRDYIASSEAEEQA